MLRSTRYLIAVLLAGFVLCVQAAGSASADAKSIEAQPLAQALDTWARQTGLQVIYGTQLTEGRKSPGARAGASPREALTQILSGSGLAVTWLNERTASIHAVKTGADAARREAMRLVSNGLPAQERASVEKKTEKESESGTAADTKGVPEILVRGSRSINTDIQRTRDDTQPYVVYDAEDIKRSQATTLEEFFKTRLPQNTVQMTSSQDATSFYGSQSQIDLRGFGTGQTLILVDGRRLPGVNAGGAVFGVRQPDINGVPLESIERIEILPSSASGIYGGGATGGVINIITRKDYNGIDMSLTYGNTSRADAENYRVDGSAGFGLSDGTSLLLAGSFTDTSPLVGSKREFNNRARAALLANNPATIYNATTPPTGYTPNIRSQNGQNLFFDDGTPLGSNRTFVPVGYAGPTSGDLGKSLLANAGKYNLGQPDDLNGGQRSLANDLTTSAVSANLRRSFGERVEAFADFSWMKNEGHALGATGFTNVITLGPNARYNPFNTTILVRIPAVGLGAPMETETATLRGAGGVIVRLPHDWTLSADHVRSRSDYSFATTNPLVGDPDGIGPGISSSTALVNGTLNPMSDLNQYRIDWTPYLFSSPNYLFDTDTRLKQTTLRASGPILQLPAGALKLSGMMERRNEDASDGYEILTGFDAVDYYPGTRQRVSTYYLEAVVPLLRSLEFQAAARRDNYHTASPSPSTEELPDLQTPPSPLTYEKNDVQATRYTVGMRFQPVRDITLRASFATGFLPPSVSQIVSIPPYEIPTLSFVDRKRGNVTQTYTNVTLYTGGNPGLQPEDSESFSAGVILTPRWVEGLRFSVDYTRIEKTNEIGSLTLPQLLELEDELPGRVIRDPLSSADAARGFSGGEVIGINSRYANIAGSRMSAWDVQLDYDVATEGFGDFHFFLLGTWQPDLERQALPITPVIEYAGYFNGILERRGNFGVTWDRGPWAVSWNTQYYSSYAIHADNNTVTQAATAALNQGATRIPSQHVHDLSVRLRLGSNPGFASWLLSDTELSAGIVNVFDRQPAVLATTNTAFGFSGYVDPRLRRYTLTLRKHF